MVTRAEPSAARGRRSGRSSSCICVRFTASGRATRAALELVIANGRRLWAIGIGEASHALPFSQVAERCGRAAIAIAHARYALGRRRIAERFLGVGAVDV